MVVIGPTGIMKIANKNIHKLLGYKKDDLVGKNVRRLPAHRFPISKLLFRAHLAPLVQIACPTPALPFPCHK